MTLHMCENASGVCSKCSTKLLDRHGNKRYQDAEHTNFRTLNRVEDKLFLSNAILDKFDVTVRRTHVNPVGSEIAVAGGAFFTHMGLKNGKAVLIWTRCPGTFRFKLGDGAMYEFGVVQENATCRHTG